MTKIDNLNESPLEGLWVKANSDELWQYNVPTDEAEVAGCRVGLTGEAGGAITDERVQIDV